MQKIVNLFILSIIALIFMAYIDASPHKGFLANSGETDTIKVFTDESPIYAIFKSDTSMTLIVSIISEVGKVLADYDMSEWSAIELKGKGRFTLEVYSEEGSGGWECEFYNKKSWTKIKSDKAKKNKN